VRAHESRAPTRPTRGISPPRSQDRPLDDGVTLDRDRRRHDQGACAPGNAFNAGIVEIDVGIAEIGTAIAGIAEIGATISGIAGIGAAITGIAGINDIKIRRRAMSLIIFGDGRMAEIIIESTAKPITADMLVRLLLAHGVIAAKIIRTQAAKEIPPPRFDQEGGGQFNITETYYGTKGKPATYRS
jgi:hypothetical protein